MSRDAHNNHVAVTDEGQLVHQSTIFSCKLLILSINELLKTTKFEIKPLRLTQFYVVLNLQEYDLQHQ